MKNQWYNTAPRDEHTLIPCSKSSIRRFIKLFLGINPTEYWFHQVLTFNPKVIDSKTAKNYLKQLLDSLEKAFPSMAAFFIQGNQKKGGIHFHLIFMFFGQQAKSPEAMREDFGKEVFTRWDKIVGGKLVRKANLMTLRKKDFRCIEYLLTGHVAPSDKPLERGCHWKGIRNKKLIAANFNLVAKKEISETYYALFPKRKLMPIAQKSSDIVPREFTKNDMDFLRAYGETRKKWDWDDFKKSELRTDKRVSDAKFMEFKNAKRNEILAKRKPVKSVLQPERKDIEGIDF